MIFIKITLGVVVSITLLCLMIDIVKALRFARQRKRIQERILNQQVSLDRDGHKPKHVSTLKRGKK